MPVVTGTSVIRPVDRLITRTTSLPSPFCSTAAIGTVSTLFTCWSVTVIDTWEPSAPVKLGPTSMRPS